jgi:hypothetical protein
MQEISMPDQSKVIAFDVDQASLISLRKALPDSLIEVVHAQAGNQSGRHTLNLEKAQTEDRWRDDGGEG